ncbi:MAG: hypothetical protein RJR37_10375 [Peptococcaceae bacterium MAG4]|nr:hypothetical protein [Peptococcaceae bacterium MAG4]
MGAAESNMDRFANRVKKRGKVEKIWVQAIISALGSKKGYSSPSPTGSQA